MPEVIPKSVICVTILSMSICLPMIALSVVNFGMLSIWLNSTVASLILLYHFGFIIASRVAKNTSPPAETVTKEDSEAASRLLEKPSTFIRIANIAILTFLVILDAIAFVIMIEITSLGAVKSTLPTERLGSHKWNIKIEIGQTSVVGLELLVLSVLLAMSVFRRQSFIATQKELMEEMDYGMI